MRKYILLLLGVIVLGTIACNPFDQQAAEEAIKEVVSSETNRLNAREISLQLNVPAGDSLIIDSLFVLTGIYLSTSFESESLVIYFNEEFKEDTIVIIGDSALVGIIRRYKGRLDYNLIGRETGTEYAAGRNFTSERTQWAGFADNKGWEMVGYSVAEERSDTNIARITHLGIKGDGLDTVIYSPAAVAPLDSFPALTTGAELSLDLKTVLDTSLVVCFVLGSEPVRFTPKVNADEQWDDRWEAEVTVSKDPLVVGVINRASLADFDYPVDLNLWIIPVTE